jgi:hypothetical protein
MKQIEVAYEELISIRDELSPNTQIVTHGYDYLLPSGVPAKFMLGIHTKAWIKPYMDQKHISLDLQAEVVKLIIDKLNEVLDALAVDHGNFHKIDLRGVLQPDEWLNEIHPTPAGFQKLATRFLPLLA